MSLSGVFEGHSLKSTQFVQRISLFLLVVAASLIFAVRHHNGLMVCVVLTLGCVVIPAGFVLARRTNEKVKQQETEERLLMQTRTFLRNEAPVCEEIPLPVLRMESNIEILARAIDGAKLPLSDFRYSGRIASLLPVAEPVVFDALPHRYAIRSSYGRRFQNPAAILPEPVCVPLNEILDAPGVVELGVLKNAIVRRYRG